MAVVVTGIGIVSALGAQERTWQRLLAGETGIKLTQPFAEISALPLALIGSQPTGLIPLTQQIVTLALADAGLTSPLSECGVVVGSSRGNQAQWEYLAKHGAIDGNWLETLPHAAAIATAHLIQTSSLVQSPMAACATGLWSIAQGFELIRTGQCDRVIAGAVEAPITPLTLAGFRQMGALARTGAYPFDRAREGLVLGEGGAVLVLESAAVAAARGATAYGEILGVGLTADGYHVSAPAPHHDAAITAVKRCLNRAQRSPYAIDYVHAHGTATLLNDRTEAHLLQTLLPPTVPVSSTKGATGHTIGASGAIGAALCLMALRNQVLLPCVGLTQPEFPLNFVTQCLPQTLTTVLCLSFGFGGQNAAIALGRVPS